MDLERAVQQHDRLAPRQCAREARTAVGYRQSGVEARRAEGLLQRPAADRRPAPVVLHAQPRRLGRRVQPTAARQHQPVADAHAAAHVDRDRARRRVYRKVDAPARQA
eukprot:2318489-Prymnesium_polylepis.1